MVLSIIGILYAFSFSAFQNFFDDNQYKIIQNKILNAVRVAQKESQLRRTIVRLCFGDSDLQCKPSQKNLIVFYQDSDTGKKLLHTVSIHTKKGRLWFRSYPFYRPFLAFFPDGPIKNDNATFWYCDLKHPDPVWVLTLSRSGMYRIKTPEKKEKLNCATSSSPTFL